jgi:hypothetical protein
MLETPLTIRPLRLVELLDAAFRLYRRNFLTFVGIMALMQIPVSLLSLFSSVVLTQSLAQMYGPGGVFSPQYFIGMGGSFLVAILSFFLVSGFATAALTRTIAASFLGRQAGVLESYRNLGSLLGNLLLSLLLAGLFSLGLWIWMLIPCIGWFSGVGMWLYFTLVIIQLLIPIVVLEKLRPIDALRRAWELARRRFWWLLGLIGVLFLLNMVLAGPAMLVNYVLQIVVHTTSGAVLSPTISVVIQSLVNVLVVLVFRPLELSVIVLTYFDLRVRSEGFDLAMQSIDVTAYPDPVDSIAAAPAAPKQTSLITGMEFGYFVAASLGGALLIALVYGLAVAFGIGTAGLFSRGF